MAYINLSTNQGSAGRSHIPGPRDGVGGGFLFNIAAD